MTASPPPSNQGSEENWGSRIGLILAVAGSAVGLGNFLRFPGQAVQNGGGAFMIPYFIAFLILGIPICWAEWTIGRHGGSHGIHSAPGILGLIGRHRFWRYVGVIGVLIPIVIYMYYVVIESWCLGYAMSYLFGLIDLGSDPGAFAERSKGFFGDYVGIGADGAAFAGGFSTSFIVWIIVFAINFFFIFRGLSGGIEKFCRIAIPIMAACAFIVLIRVLTLGTPNPELPERSVLNGLGYTWNPKPMHAGESWLAALLNPQVWLSATGQIFFSLSVGFGIIVNYASYVRRKEDIVLSGLTAAATNEFFEVCLGGLITVTAAFVFLGAAGATGGTFGLGFNTLPVVFEYMPAGHLFGFLWFFMLFLAAITSSLSMLQPAIAFLMEALELTRKVAVIFLGAVSALGSLFVIYFSHDLVALDTFDFWVGTALIFVMAMIQVFLFSFVLGVDRGFELAEEGAEMRIPRIFKFILRYVSPLYLVIIFGGWCVMNLPGYIEALSEGGVPLLSLTVISAFFIFFVLLTFVGGRRWDRLIAAAEKK